MEMSREQSRAEQKKRREHRGTRGFIADQQETEQRGGMGQWSGAGVDDCMVAPLRESRVATPPQPCTSTAGEADARHLATIVCVVDVGRLSVAVVKQTKRPPIQSSAARHPPSWSSTPTRPLTASALRRHERRVGRPTPSHASYRPCMLCSVWTASVAAHRRLLVVEASPAERCSRPSPLFSRLLSTPLPGKAVQN
jgi:hypothetical protein